MAFSYFSRGFSNLFLRLSRSKTNKSKITFHKPQNKFGTKSGLQNKFGTKSGPQNKFGTKSGPQNKFGTKSGPQNKFGTNIKLSRWILPFF